MYILIHNDSSFEFLVSCLLNNIPKINCFFKIKLFKDCNLGYHQLDFYSNGSINQREKIIFPHFCVIFLISIQPDSLLKNLGADICLKNMCAFKYNIFYFDLLKFFLPQHLKRFQEMLNLQMLISTAGKLSTICLKDMMFLPRCFQKANSFDSRRQVFTFFYELDTVHSY